MKKNSIALMIVPIFALTACDDTANYQTVATPQNDNVIKNEEGFYSTVQVNTFEKAKTDGYTGSMDDWVKLTALYETNPEQAAAQAANSGFSGGEMLLGALAGAALGGMLASSTNNRNNMASTSYSSQRLNDNINYAQTQKYNDDCKSSNDKNCNNGSSTTNRSTGSNTAALATTTNRNNINSYTNSTPKSAPAVAKPTPAVRATSISRGGFGGSFSGGGG